MKHSSGLSHFKFLNLINIFWIFFRLLLPLVVCCVEKVELNFDVDGPITVEQCAWMCIHLIRQKVYEIVKRRPNDHIFLAGWGTTCCLNHKVFIPYNLNKNDHF